MGVIKSIKSIIRKNSAGSDFIHRRINLIEGTGITLTVADDAANNEIDVTIAGGASGATTALDNLAAVAINTSLISDTDSTDDLGSATIFWANAYIDALWFLGGTYSVNLTSGANGRLDLKASGVVCNWNLGDNPYFSVGQQGVNNLSIQWTGQRFKISVSTSYIESGNTFASDSDSWDDLGTSTKYWLNTYTDKLFLNSTATIAGSTAGHLLFVGDLVPATDDTEWVGQLETPFKAIKGLICKDTTNGKHYKITVVNGVVTTTALD